MMIQLRQSCLRDLASVTDVLTASYGQLLRGWYDDAVLEAALPDMGQAQPDLLERGTYYVVEEQSAVIAAGGWSVSFPDNDLVMQKAGHVRHFATHPDHLRKGAAGAIMERCLLDARQQGIEKMQCISTLAATDFYQKFGFRETHRRSIRLRSGVLFPSVYMALRFS